MIQPGEIVRNILFIGVARIGDTLLLTPAMRALKERFPMARLTVLAHPKRCEVLENLDFIDSLGSITKTSACLKGWLPTRPYDLAFVYGRDEALVRYALRVARRVYCFAEEGFASFPEKRLIRVERPHGVHAIKERAALVEKADVKVNRLRLDYRITPLERHVAEKRLSQLGAAGRHPLIGLQAFSFPTKAHRDWPLENFCSLIEAICAVYPEAIFLVLGDTQAARLAKPLVDRFPGCVLVVAGDQPLRASAAFMSLLDLYVGVDTGPTHIAGALNIPMIAMYHNFYPGRNLAPLQRESCHVVEHPATQADDDPRGMAAISSEQIIELALASLESSGFPRE